MQKIDLANGKPQKSSDKLTLGKITPKMVGQENEVSSRKRANNRKMTKQVSLTTIWKRPEQNSDSEMELLS